GPARFRARGPAARLMMFHSLYAHDFIRVAAATPDVAPADPRFNLAATEALLVKADAEAAAIAVFPELGLSAYAIDDLLFQDAMLDGVEAALAQLAAATISAFPVAIVGAPLRRLGRLYNCALVIHRGKILGVVPKTYLPNYREFYEKRHFASG